MTAGKIVDLGDLGEVDLFEGVEVAGKKPRAPTVRELNTAVHKVLDNDDLGIDEIWRIASDKREWIEDSAVVLIHEQECLGCGTVSTFSHGWFTGKHHARDKTASQLTAGKPLGYYPRRVQRVRTAPVDVCGACAESQALIENIAGPEPKG